MLMARHRQAELHDAHWLERFEQQELGAGAWGAHGTAFRAKRDIEGLDAGWIGNLIPLRRMFGVWVVGLAMFGLAAIVVIAKTVLTLAV